MRKSVRAGNGSRGGWGRHGAQNAAMLVIGAAWDQCVDVGRAFIGVDRLQVHQVAHVAPARAHTPFMAATIGCRQSREGRSTWRTPIIIPNSTPICSDPARVWPHPAGRRPSWCRSCFGADDRRHPERRQLFRNMWWRAAKRTRRAGSRIWTRGCSGEVPSSPLQPSSSHRRRSGDTEVCGSIAALACLDSRLRGKDGSGGTVMSPSHS